MKKKCCEVFKLPRPRFKRPWHLKNLLNRERNLEGATPPSPGLNLEVKKKKRNRERTCIGSPAELPSAPQQSCLCHGSLWNLTGSRLAPAPNVCQAWLSASRDGVPKTWQNSQIQRSKREQEVCVCLCGSSKWKRKSLQGMEKQKKSKEEVKVESRKVNDWMVFLSGGNLPSVLTGYFSSLFFIMRDKVLMSNTWAGAVSTSSACDWGCTVSTGRLRPGSWWSLTPPTPIPHSHILFVANCVSLASLHFRVYWHLVVYIKTHNPCSHSYFYFFSQHFLYQCLTGQ